MNEKNGKKNGMRILRLETSNIKKLKVVDITLNKYINRITGANGSGKTSALDAIEWALIGGATVPTAPVRKGAVRGTVKLHMGEGETVDVIVTRTFFEGGAKRAGRLDFEVMPGKDGSAFEGKRKKISNPDELKDKLLGQVSFDPLEFLRMKPADQYHVLRRIAMHDFDMDALDLKIQEAFDNRKQAGRKKEDLAGQLSAYDDLPAEAPEKRDERALVEQLTAASEYNGDLDRQQRQRDDETRQRDEMIGRMTSRTQRISALRAEIATLEDANKEDSTTLGKWNKAIAGWEPLPAKMNPREIQEQIDEARAINRVVERAEIRDRVAAEFKTAHAEWDSLDKEVKEGERRKLEAIAHAEYPVPGLGFGNKEVMYQELPFDQASQAEQIRVSAAIGMHANSDVRVMRIKDGSLLDETSLGIVSDLAHANNYQVIIESVDTTGKIGFYLEEGEVKAVNAEPLDAPTQPAKKPRRKPAAK